MLRRNPDVVALSAMALALVAGRGWASFERARAVDAVRPEAPRVWMLDAPERALPCPGLPALGPWLERLLR